MSAIPLGRKSTSLRAGFDGKFEARGLLSGPVNVQAESGNRVSAWVPASLSETSESPPLRLVASPKMAVHYRVSSAAGPVAGALVEAAPAHDEAPIATMVESVSDADGKLALSLPGGTREVELAVIAPGYAIRMLRLAADPKARIEIQLESGGGSLVLALGKTAAELVRGSLVGLLAHAGTAVPLSRVARWARLQGGSAPDLERLVIAGVEPGEYQLCLAGQAGSNGRAGQEQAAAQCSTGLLGPLAELELAAAGRP